MDDASIAAVEEAERRRAAALLTRDADALADLLSADLIYVHGNGHRDDKTGYLHRFAAGEYVFLAIAREDEHVWSAGETVTVVGRRMVTVNPPGIGETHVDSFATCIWRREDPDVSGGCWRMLFYQGTFLPG